MNHVGRALYIDGDIRPSTSLGEERDEQQPLAHVRLLDISGRAVLTEHVATDRHTLRLHGIPAGVYLLETTDIEGGRASKKIMRMAER